jgi:hypothetical protein
LGDCWHIAAGTEKNPPKSAGCVISGKAPCISRCDVHDMPTVGPTIERSATVRKLDAES